MPSFAQAWVRAVSSMLSASAPETCTLLAHGGAPGAPGAAAANRAQPACTRSLVEAASSVRLLRSGGWLVTPRPAGKGAQHAQQHLARVHLLNSGLVRAPSWVLSCGPLHQQQRTLHASSPALAPRKMPWYVVLAGLDTGVFTRWDDVKRNTQGIKRAVFMGFKTRLDAEEYLQRHQDSIMVRRAWRLAARARGACR